MMRRRQVLAALGTGAASALAAPVFARTDDDQTIGAALDTAATLPPPRRWTCSPRCPRRAPAPAAASTCRPPAPALRSTSP